MVIDSSEKIDSSEGKIEAVLFEAISHPTRIKILFSLEKKAHGFADLKRKLGITSSGNLQHHISKLATLIRLDNSGDYILSDQGRDALVTIKSLRNVQNHQNNTNQYTTDRKITTFGAALSFYVVQMNMPFVFGNVDQLTPITALISSLVFAVVFYPIYGFFESRRMNKSKE